MEEKHVRWTKISNLRDPFNDAVNYRSRQQKDFFNQIFLRTRDLFDCLKPPVYYLIGEKGSGKTAYATYLENTDVDGNRCKLSTMTETQYKRFIELKKNGKLDYSDYANIWRPMLLHMVAQALVEKSKGLIDGFTGKFDELESEIAHFNRKALNPEVEVAFEMVTSQSETLAVGHQKIAVVELVDSALSSNKSQQIGHHLLEQESRLKEAISDLRLRKNHILFIDGIDYRPEAVPYLDYLACVKGLGEAAWQLNLDYFSNIRDSKGRIKIVLLIRPDVFHTLNLYNSNSRLRDNSVLLDWSTTESEARQSMLYEAADRYFSSQQEFDSAALEAADHYLSTNAPGEIFKKFLRSSFQKPRDLLTLIRLAKDISIKHLGRGAENALSSDVLRHPVFTREYSDYMLGEVRNYAAFYMPSEDFNRYLKFFQYLDGRSEFDFLEFSKAFEKFRNWANGENMSATDFLRDAEALLQLFYDVNLVGYRENVGDGERHIHFAFRERTLTNVAPQIKLSAGLIINPGVAKALDIGLRSKQKEIEANPERRRSRPKSRPKAQPKPQSKPQSKTNQAPSKVDSVPTATATTPPPAKPTRRRRRKRRKPTAE